MAQLIIRPMRREDLPLLKEFTDRAIGTNYYSPRELEDIFERSQSQGQMCSYVLADETLATPKILGVRITYPPGGWSKGKGSGLNPEKWGVPFQNTAYFQSLFLDSSTQGQGWGKQMSLASIETLKKLGAQAVVCHSWKESPNDSSGKYLRSMGFELIASHPLYWKEVDYVCTRCGKPCLCTAEEMILRLS